MSERRRGSAHLGPAKLVLVPVMVLLMSALAACSSTGPHVANAPEGTEINPPVLVTMGAVETSNLDFRTDRRDTWTQIVFDKAMPAAAVLINLAGDNITAERVIDTQLPELASLHPTVVTIWVESADVRVATPTATYQAELAQLVAGARQAGAHKVLLVTPPANQQDRSGALAESVAAVATNTGARLATLGDTSDRYSDAGQRRIAASVIAALE